MTDTETIQKISPESQQNLDERETLKQQNITLRELLDKSIAENTRYKQRLEQFAHALQERDRRIAELQLFEYRLKKTGERSINLENQIASSQAALKTLQEEKEAAERNLDDSQQHGKQLERVIQFLRERAETGRLELRQVQTELTAAQETIAKLMQKSEETAAFQDALQFQIKYEQASKQELTDELAAIHQQWAQLQHAARHTKSQNAQTAQLIASLLAERQQLEIALLAKDNELTLFEHNFQKFKKEISTQQARYNTAVNGNIAAVLQAIRMREELLIQEDEIEELHRQRQEDRAIIAALQKFQQHYEDSLAATTSQRAEKEAELKIAQQHLAKRVKEATLLSERNETLHREIAELQKKAAEAQSSASALQHALEEQKQAEKSAQERFAENMKVTEGLVGAWEAKYQQIYDRWQEAEARNHALKAIEEKQIQMQALLHNLSALTGSSAMPGGTHPQPNVHALEIKKPSLLETFERSERIERALHPQHAETQAESNNFFEVPKPSVRFKQTLFD